jgi:hypothetical protein
VPAQKLPLFSTLRQCRRFLSTSAVSTVVRKERRLLVYDPAVVFRVQRNAAVRRPTLIGHRVDSPSASIRFSRLAVLNL